MIRAMTSNSQQAIRAARAALNDAIARRDVDGIAAFFLSTYRVVTARSRQYDGKEASRRSWSEMLGRDPSMIHNGTPDEIHVNDEWGMAEERGRWTGRVAAIDGPIDLTGVYSAKWHNTPDGWLLQAEIFTPLTITRS
jgi:ketosteroid isomerase-like protein